MNVDIEFSGPESEALLVPTVAIVTKKGSPGVLVPDEKGKPIFKPVMVGATQSSRSRSKSKNDDANQSGDKSGGSSGKTQITEGLKEGDRVFITLPEGQKLDQLLKDDKDKK
jgi:HlyD family secretion protein